MDPNSVLEVLLRRAGGGGSPLPAQPHLDPDTVSAFAAGALPQSFRNDCVSHLADCARCRVMLAAAATFEPVAADERVLAAMTVKPSWWNGLVRVPAFAYAGLFSIVLFGGLIAFLALSGVNESVEISQVRDEAPSAAATPVEAGVGAEAPKAVKESAPAEPGLKESEKPTIAAPVVTDRVVSAPSPPPMTTSPGRDEAADREMRIDESTRPAARMSPPKSVSESAVGIKRVKGRTFVDRDGIWTDTEYRGGDIIEIARGSADFNALDSELRSLSVELPEPFIVVWKGRAYRIR